LTFDKIFTELPGVLGDGKQGKRNKKWGEEEKGIEEMRRRE